MPARISLRPIVVAAGTGLFLAACGKRDRPAESIAAATTGDTVALDSTQRGQIRTATVDSSQYRPVVITTGTVAFNGDRSTQVLAPISGPVSRILVSPGALVSRGQALATVASPDFATAVADYRKAESAARNAERIAKLDEQLFANDALARSELDQAHTDLAAAAADRDAAVSQLRSLGVGENAITAIREGRSVAGAEAAIRAPIGGTVVEKLITPGQLLQAGSTEAFTIADLSSVWVMANVFEGDVAVVRHGEKAWITTGGSPDTLPGTVDYVAALVDPATRATMVRIVVPNRGGLLRRDMLVNVEIHAMRPRSGILVPVAAVLRDEDNLPYVYVANGTRGYDRRRIGLGARVGDRYEVRSGLKAGESVVTQGALFLAGSGAS